MSYSLSQAATATGKDRSTIQRAIKKGKISAILNEDGAYQIDPAELHRVFPVVAMPDAQPVALQQSAMMTQREIESENRELRAKVELLREMVDDLRGRLDVETAERRESAAEIRRLTLMLTHQPAPKIETPLTLPKDRVTVRPLLWVALAVASISAAIAQWLVYHG